MENIGTTLHSLLGNWVFAMAVDDRLTKTQNTLLDENNMIRLGMKPNKVTCKIFAYGGNLTWIIAEAKCSAQTVFNGVQAGNTFLKMFVVPDLKLFYGVDPIAGGQLFTKLSSTENDDSFVNLDAKIDNAKPSCKSPADKTKSPKIETKPLP